MKSTHSLLTCGHVKLTSWSLVLSAAGLISAAHAANVTWTGAVNGTWDTTTANWTGASTTFASGDNALFAGTPTTNVTTAAALTIGTITLDNTFTGSVTVTGNNTVNGATTISGGTLVMKHGGTTTGDVSRTDLGTSAITVNSGGTFFVDETGAGTTGAERIFGIPNAISGAGVINAKAGELHTAGWSSINFQGNLSGFTGTLNVVTPAIADRAKVKFSAASQAAVLSSSATVNVQNGAQLYLNQAYNYGFGLHLNGGIGGEGNGSLRLDNGTLNVTGSITLDASSSISGNGTISGNIGEAGGARVLSKVGGGTTVLSGSNNYSGGTTISGGTLQVRGSSPLGTGAVSLAGGQIAFNAANSAVTVNNNISGNANGNWTFTPTNKITLGGTSSVGFNNNFTGLTINAGAGGVDITGSLTINGGGNPAGYLTMLGTSTLTIQPGGSLSMFPSNSPGAIVGGNVAGTSTVLVNGGNLTFDGNMGLAFGNNSADAVGVLTISSGTATIHRGSTTATDARSFIALGRDNATGTINLNGGTLATDRNFVHDSSNGGTAGAGTSNFVFGGGTLKALANQGDWLNSTTINTNQLPLTSVTATAISTIDSNGFAVGINSAISGAGGLTITDSSGSGNGVVTFGGAKTYTGGTLVTGGTLAISGTLDGLVNVSTAGRLAVGESAPSTTMASQSISSLTLGTGGALKFDIDTVGSNDQLTITTPSGLTINGGGVYLHDAGSTNALTDLGTFTLIHYSGTLNGSITGLSVVNGRVGYAYTFADTGSAIEVTVALTNDTDGDGMPDVWEDANGLNKLVNDANDNADGDFSTNYEEYLASTNPQSPSSDPKNTDNDGLRDSWEIDYFDVITAQNGSGDPDGDFATNAEEQAAGTDPRSRTSAPDSDFDTMGDAWELEYFTDLATANITTDQDGDTYPDADEFYANTDPNDPLQTPDDTDRDGLDDNWEMRCFNNLNQIGTGDPDGDYATNAEEEAADTDGHIRTSAPDLDNGGVGDGIGDAWELHYFTNTTTATATSDSDGDTLSDRDEFLANTDPLNNKDPYSGTAVIAWQPPVTVTADTDILSTGDLIHAGNFRSDNANVAVTVGAQTVTFEARQSQNAAGVLLAGEEARVIAGSGGRQVNGDLFNAVGTTVGAAFESVLDGSAWENADAGPAPGATDIILRVTGVDGAALVTGQQYRIQLFYSDDRGSSSGRAQVFHDDMAGSSPSGVMSASDSMYVVGTFTASSTGYQDIHVRNTSGGNNFPVAINAYVLRTVGADPDADNDGIDDAWETANGLNPNANDSAVDSDNDGIDNLGEFAFNGDPQDGSDNGVGISSLQDTNSNGQKELTLTIAVRSGATFAAGLDGTQVATVEGLTYTVRGSLNLSAFTSAVAQVSTAASGDPAYQLHTFRLTASEGLSGKGFLQATAVAAP